MDREEFKARVSDAISDEAGRIAREDVCRKLAATFQSTGQLLWVGGAMLGTDRREGQSPFGFGEDAAVGLALVVQIAGELAEGAIALLEQDRLYAASALLRQMVEVEYLAWAFAEDKAEATDWMRSSREERLKRWQPRQLRERSGGRFRGADYGGHCEHGGHPTPEATVLLSGHSTRQPATVWWLDLATHGVSAWEYVVVAAGRLDLDYSKEVRAKATEYGLPDAIADWKRKDPLPKVFAELRSSPADEPVG